MDFPRIYSIPKSSAKEIIDIDSEIITDEKSVSFKNISYSINTEVVGEGHGDIEPEVDNDNLAVNNPVVVNQLAKNISPSTISSEITCDIEAICTTPSPQLGDAVIEKYLEDVPSLHKIKRHSLADKQIPPVIYPRWKADE